MTMHFPFICFTSLAAARIASCLTVSNVSFCVTAQPPSFTITSTSHLSAITTDEKAKCEICQACFFHPDSLVCLVPRGFWTLLKWPSPDQGVWSIGDRRNNKAFIIPFLLILKKIRFFISLFHQKGHYFIISTPNFRYTSSIIRETTPRFFQSKRILLPLGFTGILEYHYPLPIPTARCLGFRSHLTNKIKPNEQTKKKKRRGWGEIKNKIIITKVEIFENAGFSFTCVRTKTSSSQFPRRTRAETLATQARGLRIRWLMIHHVLTSITCMHRFSFFI